jgi:hypothetical protein
MDIYGLIMEIWRNFKNYMDIYGFIMDMWRILNGFKGMMEEFKRI